MISRKNIVVTFAGATSVSMATSATSDAIDVKDLVYGSIQCVFTGAPVGSIKVQCSNGLEAFLQTPPTPPPGITLVWTDITDTTIAISAAGDIMYNFTNLSYDQMRIVYTSTSGTGTLSARMVGKG